MTKKEKLEIRAHLTGRIPLELQGEEIPTPTDREIKNFLVNTSSDDLLRIGQGPHGEYFRAMTKAAMARITAEEMKGKPPANGRSSGTFHFAPDEVSSGVASVDPDRSKK
jgi:hypothetical protein